MNTSQSRSRLNRRDFLKLLFAGGTVAAGAYVLSEYTPWMDYDGQSRRIRVPDTKDPGPATQMRTLVHYATLAANGHNTQPWKFSIQENDIEIHPDTTRRLPVVDPDNRELWMSLGCALENLLIAARAKGFSPEVTYPDAAEFIHIRLTPDAPQSSPLFDAIPLRQNTRSEYDGQPIKKTDLDQLQALPLEPGVVLRFTTTASNLETILEYVNQGNLNQYANKAFIEELIHWLRFNRKEALASYDGLYSVCSGNPEVPGWLGRMFVDGTKPQQQAETDAKKLRSSSAAVVIASTSETRSDWVRAGQVYERVALQTTVMGIKSAFLNQPIEVAAIRPQLQSALSLGSAQPQLLVRLGFANEMPRSLRRPLEQVVF